MKVTVQYIPLSKIKPGLSAQLTQRIKELRKAAQDCMNLLIVRKSRKDGGYIIVSGNQQYEYLKMHTRNKYAPCLVDESKAAERFFSFISRLQKRKLPYEVPSIKRDRTSAGSWSIIRTFMKQEPRFKQLSRTQQLKVLRLGLQYQKTTVHSMKSKVDAMLKK